MIPIDEMPQANNLNDVIKTIFAVANGFVSDDKIAEYLNKGTSRQGRYYRKSAVQLKFIENTGNESKLTALGKEFLQIKKENESMREEMIVKQVLNIRPIEIVYTFINDNPDCTRQDILGYIDENILGSIETKTRRLSSIVQWLKHLNLIEDENNTYNIKYYEDLLKLSPRIEDNYNKSQDNKRIPYITELLSALRSSSIHSVVTETSSLSSKNEIQDLLYVETGLDDYLVTEISKQGEEKWDLVVLAGNAGEGKSALIKKIDKELSNKIPLNINWDATHSDNPREDQVDVLGRFFAPFSDGHLEKRPENTHLIAMNTGMIISFFEKMKHFSNKKSSFNTLYQLLQYKLELTNKKEDRTAWRVLLINLDHRSVLSSSPENESLLKKMIKKLNVHENNTFLGPSYKEHCKNCEFQKTCPILFNLESIQVKNVQEQLQNLLFKITLEEDLHLTPRAVWDFIYHVITVEQVKQVDNEYSNATCPVINSKKDKNLIEKDLSNQLFFQYLFTNSSDNELLSLINKYDPSLVSSQALDTIATQLAVQPQLDEFTDINFGFELLQIVRHNVDQSSVNEAIEYALLVKRRKYFFSSDPEIEKSFQKSESSLEEYDKLIDEYIRYSVNQEESNSEEEYSKVIDLIGEKIPKALQASFGTWENSELFSIDDLRRANKHQLLVKLKPSYYILPKKKSRNADSSYYSALTYRPREVIFEFFDEDTSDSYGELVINFGLFQLFNLISQGYMPSSIDFNRFYHFRFFCKQLFNKMAKNTSQYMLIEDKLNDKKFFIESPKNALQRKFKVGEVN
ncbi:DNA phosphorothioation-dependent restriction protein DptF (plasmid) [Priestia megaterium]|uniref:DNA phosphorothioation-dependent restriction protein DptF n=1 Tax=Priestia megaterium TaxID=1404 RepID=UPI000D3E0E35|nr:DNA phosphorothioation-dependent restriction protein DptF [Priestia megaterium]AWD68661.1 DNA phosphorothioation-dependent restriction protein DptF [Priestia megaterium]